MSTQPFQNNLNPWYFMYQPVSYRLAGRMGTRDDLRSTIHTCRKLGVRVYADAVVSDGWGIRNSNLLIVFFFFFPLRMPQPKPFSFPPSLAPVLLPGQPHDGRW